DQVRGRHDPDFQRLDTRANGGGPAPPGGARRGRPRGEQSPQQGLHTVRLRGSDSVRKRCPIYSSQSQPDDPPPTRALQGGRERDGKVSRWGKSRLVRVRALPNVADRGHIDAFSRITSTPFWHNRRTNASRKFYPVYPNSHPCPFGRNRRVVKADNTAGGSG